MNIINKKIITIVAALGLFLVSGFSVSAQFRYDGGTTYPIYDGGTTYPIYDGGTTYPIYDGGTTYPIYDGGTTYPIYDGGTTYSIYDGGTTYPIYDGGTTYSIYDGGTGYSTVGYTVIGNNYTTPGNYYTTGNNYYTNGGYYTTGNSYYVNGGTNVVTTIPTTTTSVCSDGSAPVNGSCNKTTTIPVTNNLICADGQAPINNSCVRTVTGNVVTTTTCPSGTVWNGSNCVQNVTGSIITNTSCPSGTVWNGSNCVQTVTGPVITNTTCPWNTTWNGSACVSTITPVVTSVIPTTQTCWNGAVIPTTSVCPSQYKMCANNVSVHVNQSCPSLSTYVSPIKVTFNNVVTSLATEVTHQQGRCNAIGLIAQGAPSTGWFEYGETANLGRSTAKANIGSSDTAPFSNLLTNLKPSTKYYCRAVMENKFGVVKGEIVSFTTKGSPATYAKVKTPVSSTQSKAKTPVKKNEIVCSDGSVVPVKNQSAATLISEGKSLITLSIEKTGGRLVSEQSAQYKVVYKNNTDSRLTDVVIRVKLPEEARLLETSAGAYDAGTRTLTLQQNNLDPYSEQAITFSIVIAKDATLGKTIVFNSYALYTIPGTVTQDEVTAYVLGSIAPNQDGTSTTGAKKVIGASSGSGEGFLPNSLIEWLALLAILFIIFILGRSIHASYKEGEAHH